ncbi:MAG: FAD binding domain-containing protein [Pseudomonadota bacterium]
MTSRYLRPTDLQPALEALAAGGLTVAAGCTDLFPATERKHLAGDILDITAVTGLRGISRRDGDLIIGAATTWSDIARAELPAALDGLKLASREVGALQIQNRGTIAGNLCNASPAADGVPPLLTLDARVVLRSVRGARELPLTDFLTGPRQTARAPDELLTAVRLPQAGLAGRGHFLKLGARKYLVISIAMGAARIELSQGRIARAALAIGACGPVAIRLAAVEQALIGQTPAEAAASAPDLAGMLAPIDDIRADAPYRARAAAELVRRLIHGFDAGAQDRAA